MSEGKIPIRALVMNDIEKRKELRITNPVVLRFEQPKLTDRQIADMAAQLGADIRQALLKLLEDSGGCMPCDDQTSEVVQKIIIDVCNRICKQYSLMSISITVEL